MTEHHSKSARPAVSDLIQIDRELSDGVSKLSFAPPVAHIYNPLEYAREPHELYLSRYAAVPGRIILLGMNPGPFGMAQCGVPFGDIALVRDWMGVTGKVERPPSEHPKRPIEGFACSRSEVSGSRLWGWAKHRFGSAQRFFDSFFVINYCPLVFMEDSGRNRTPDKLPSQERSALYALCDHALRRWVSELRPSWVLGVGKFAQTRAQKALAGDPPNIGCILHPSPASPAANRGWAPQVERQLAELGIQLPAQGR